MSFFIYILHCFQFVMFALSVGLLVGAVVTPGIGAALVAFTALLTACTFVVFVKELDR